MTLCLLKISQAISCVQTHCHRPCIFFPKGHGSKTKASFNCYLPFQALEQVLHFSGTQRFTMCFSVGHKML